MADALCGPSNPLQNFRKQTQLDRTLQQDRLVGPSSSAAQGFRSRDPRAGTLDADLHAFEHSTPSPLSFQFQQPSSSQPALARPTRALGWAADFQKMHISSPPVNKGAAPGFEPPAFWDYQREQDQHHQHAKEMMIQNASVETLERHGQTWNSELRHALPQDRQVFQMPEVRGNTYNPSTSYASPFAQQPYQALPDFSQQLRQDNFGHQTPDFQFADSVKDMEAAFQDAFQQVESLDQKQQEPERAMYNSNGLEIDEPLDRQLPIGSDAINYVEQVDRTHNQDTKDADELAKTAGQLLNMVQHDTSDKMKNSQFLNLMRKLRDREVEVQNNDIQQTHTNSLDKGMKNSYMENETDFRSLHDRQAEFLQTSANHPSTSHQEANDPNSFAFPDMDSVYAFNAQTESGQSRPMTPAEMQYSSHDDEYPRTQIQALHPGGRWYPEQKSPRLGRAEFLGGASMQVDGKGESVGDARMSGAVNAGLSGLMNIGTGPVMGQNPGVSISADDFESRFDESPVLGRRYAQP